MKLLIILFTTLFCSCGVYIPHNRIIDLYDQIPGKAFYEITDSLSSVPARKVVKEYFKNYRYYQY